MSKRSTTEEFIKKSIFRHGDRYKYEKSNYISNNKNIIITCIHHGDFPQRPSHHLDGAGCPQCGILKMANNKKSPRYNTKIFIDKSNKVHNQKYNYDSSIFTFARNKIEIICNDHGPFWQTAQSHLHGEGCPTCRLHKLQIKNRSRLITKEEFLIRTQVFHPNSPYDYSKVVCNGTMEKITIICPTHGEFTQRQNTHLMGHGCPICGNSINLSEQKLYNLLKSKFPNESIEYQSHQKWLGRQSLDIFIPKLKLAIEYQGEQHLRPFPWFGGNGVFQKIIERDKRKYELCKNENITLIYFSYTIYKDESQSILPIWHDMTTLLKFIGDKLE